MNSTDSTSTGEPRREFTNEELTEIIREAARRSQNADRGKVSYDEMLSIGAELGIDRAAIESAANDIGDVRRHSLKMVRKRFEFFQHFMVYGIVIFALFLLNLMTGTHTWWFMFPAIGWGIGLGCHAASVYLAEKAALLGLHYDISGEDRGCDEGEEREERRPRHHERKSPRQA